jgi:thioredoxin-related protein
MGLINFFWLSFFFSTNVWLLDFSEAQIKAKENHQMILINFSGSDWCGPCIQMHKDVFEKDDFKAFADKNLVLLKADFPRLEKNKLTAQQLKKNNDLAVRYNPDGDFPLTLLLDKNLKVLKIWSGNPGLNGVEFVKEIDVLNN